MAWPSKIFVATTLLGVYYTDDFSDPNVQPTWTAINTGLPALDCNEFDLDPFDQLNRQYVLLWTGETLYRRENAGSWISILTPSQARTACGQVGGTMNLRSFCADLTVPGRLWALFRWNTNTYAIRSDDYGDNWIGHLVTNVNTEDVWHIRSSGNYVWLATYAGTLYLHNDWVFYSSDLGITWNQYYTWEGHHFGYNPLTPDRIYEITGVTGTHYLTRITSGGVGTDLQTNIALPARQDSMWFDYIDPDHHRELEAGEIHVTTDEWATIDSTLGIDDDPISFAPWAGADVDQMIIGFIADDPSNHHVIGTLYGEADTVPHYIAGINVNTPPYTDAIPYSHQNQPCERGIRALQPTVGKINTYAVAMPGYSDVGLDRGIPMAGDRSAWDAKNYPLRHTDDINTGIHWTADKLAALPIVDHDHSGDVGDGGQFDADHLLSTGAGDGDILTSDGAGAAVWEAPIGGGHTIEDEGIPLIQRTNLDFTGNGVTVSDDAVNDRTIVTIPGYVHIINEDHSASCNGATVQFFTVDNFIAGSTVVTLNGITQRPGAGNSYEEDVGFGSITFATAPHTDDELLISYIKSGTGPGSSAPTDIYIDTVGGDDGTGDGTIGNPYATLAKALSILPDEIRTTTTIHVADGTYTEGIPIKRFRSPQSAMLIILGNTSTPANVIFTGTTTSGRGADGDADDSDISCGLVAAGPIRFWLEGVKDNVTAFYGILASWGATVWLKNCISTGTLTRAVVAYHGAHLIMEGTLDVSGFSFVGIDINLKSEGTILNGADITIVGPGSGTTIGYNTSNGSVSNIWGTSTISISEIQQGIVSNLASNILFLQNATISITNASTPANSYAFETTDTSSLSTWGTLTIDHFTIGFYAVCLTYQEHVGPRNLTNVGTTSFTADNSDINLN